MKPSKATRTRRRRRQFSKKTYRNKKRGGMHMHKHEKTQKKAETRQREHGAARAALSQLPAISPLVRSSTLTSSALADTLTARFLNPQMSRSFPPVHSQAVLGREPTPAIFVASDMFRQAEKLSLDLRTLPEEQAWTQEHQWSSKNFTPEAMGMCTEAARLYRGAVDLKHLPAYAPLAWMLSFTNPEQSLSLCNECIRACDARTGVPFAREAKIDCTAIRAFVQYQEEVKEMYDELETMAPTPQGQGWGWGAPEPDLSMRKLHATAEESIAAGSKYGYALRLLLLSNDFEATRNEPEIARVQSIAEENGLDLQRCRFCLM